MKVEEASWQRTSNARVAVVPVKVARVGGSSFVALIETC